MLKADPAYRLQPSPIEAAIHLDREAGLRPFLLVGTAGTTSTGSVDALDDLAEVAVQEGLWFHVDGAYGAPARLTPRGKDLLTGIERADSLVLDPHKWLFQPYEIGAVLVRRPGLLQHTFTLDGAYLRDSHTGMVELREYGPQLTRSARALKLWLSLRVFGLDAFKAAIAHTIALAEYAEAELERRGGWEVVSPATLAVVCFRRKGHGDDETDALVRAAVADGFAAPSTTILDGRAVVRLCTINPRTTEADVAQTIDRLERPRPLRHLHTTHVDPDRSDLGRSRLVRGSWVEGSWWCERTQSLCCHGGGAGEPYRRAGRRRGESAVDRRRRRERLSRGAVQDDPERDLRRRGRARHADDRGLPRRVHRRRRRCRVQRPDHHRRRQHQGRGRRPRDDQAAQGAREHELDRRQRDARRTSATPPARS